MKKVVSLFLAAAMTLSLAACGSPRLPATAQQSAPRFWR